MSRTALGLWLTTVIWIAVTGGMWAYHDYQVENGTEVALKTVPIDPRDVLRGDYVVLRYEISSVEIDDEVLGYVSRNQVIFVSLDEVSTEAEAGIDWIAGQVSRAAPAEGVFLRGRVRSALQNRLEVEYGIESFFVPEGEGGAYESARNRDSLWAVVRISPHGVARLKRLEIR